MQRAKSRRQLPRPWTIGLVSHHQDALGLQKVNGRVTGSKAVMMGKITGTKPVGVGEPGDGILGLEMAADVLNEFYGITAALPNPVDEQSGRSAVEPQRKTNQQAKTVAAGEGSASSPL